MSIILIFICDAFVNNIPKLPRILYSSCTHYLVPFFVYVFSVHILPSISGLSLCLPYAVRSTWFPTLTTLSLLNLLVKEADKVMKVASHFCVTHCSLQ